MLNDIKNKKDLIISIFIFFVFGFGVFFVTQLPENYLRRGIPLVTTICLIYLHKILKFSLMILMKRKTTKLWIMLSTISHIILCTFIYYKLSSQHFIGCIISYLCIIGLEIYNHKIKPTKN